MPPDPPASDYLATVERFYLVLRRQGLTLSAVDIKLVQEWELFDIPVHVVCKALLDGAERFHASQGESERLPGTLHYFRRAVADAAKRYAANHPKSTTSAAPSDTTLSDELAELAWIGRAETDTLRRNAYRAAWRSLKNAADTSRNAALQEADGVAADTLFAALRPDQQEALNARVEALLAPELPTLGTQGLALRRRAMLEDELCRQYGLVRLSDIKSANFNRDQRDTAKDA